MKKVGAVLALVVFALTVFASLPATAFGLRLGPFHLGVPSFGHRHHHHPLYMHGNSNDVARHDSHETPQAAPQHGAVSLALLYPTRALPPIFQNVFWPAFSSPWPFSYDAIFTTSFAAPAADRNRDDCRQAFDANAMVERLRAKPGAAGHRKVAPCAATCLDLATDRTVYAGAMHRPEVPRGRHFKGQQ